jgi:8-oxo-dGTP pyrophosphatase MutT (NUDIX family)
MIRISSSDKIIRLTSNEALFEPRSGCISLAVNSETELVNAYRTFMQAKEVGEIFFYNKNEDFLLNAFKSMFKIVEAAGGLVKNPEGKYLFIFRNGKWDLPKGKIEKGEEVKEAAMREVEEECGIGGLTIIQQLETTYHTYTMENKEILKPTYWFEMTCSDTSALLPQTEEGITDVKWLGKKDLEVVRKNTYASVKDLIEGL